MHMSLDLWGIYVTKEEAKTMSLVDQQTFTAEKVAGYLVKDCWRDVGLNEEVRVLSYFISTVTT